MRPLGLESVQQVQGWPSLSQPPSVNTRGLCCSRICHPGGRAATDRIQSKSLKTARQSPGGFYIPPFWPPDVPPELAKNRTISRALPTRTNPVMIKTSLASTDPPAPKFLLSSTITTFCEGLPGFCFSEVLGLWSIDGPDAAHPTVLTHRAIARNIAITVLNILN